MCMRWLITLLNCVIVWWNCSMFLCSICSRVSRWHMMHNVNNICATCFILFHANFRMNEKKNVMRKDVLNWTPPSSAGCLRQANGLIYHWFYYRLVFHSFDSVICAILICLTCKMLMEYRMGNVNHQSRHWGKGFTIRFPFICSESELTFVSIRYLFATVCCIANDVNISI